MTDLKALIDRLDAPDDWDLIVRRSPSRNVPEVAPTIRNDRIRRATIAVLSLGAAGLAIVFLIRAFETSPPPGPPQVQPVVRTFEFAPGIGHMEVAFGSLWVVESDGVIRVDPRSGEVVAEIPVPGITARDQRGAPDWSWIASGAGRVWVTAEPDIVGINPRTNEIVQRFADQSGVSRITFANGLIVVGGSAEGNGDIRVMDPQTETYADGGGLAGSLAGFPSVLVTRDWYWAGGETHEGGAALARISKDGTAHEVIEGIASFDSFTAAGGFVWVTGGDRLYRVDDTYEGPAPSPQSVFPAEADAVSAEIAIQGPGQVASDGTTLWLLEGTEDGSPRLTEIDPVTGAERSASVSIAGDGPIEIAVADGDAWVSFRSSGQLVTLDAPPLSEAAPDNDSTLKPERRSGPIPGAFYPATYREGDRIIMPVTFVDGTTAEVVFRGDLGADELGTYGEIAGGLGEVERSIYFRYGTGSQFKASGPLASYQGNGGSTVEEWTPPTETFGSGNFACPILVFRFGDWFVGVRTCYDELSSEEKAQWARLLLGRQTEDGFLVLDAEPPLTIAAAGEHEGPDLWLQGSDRGSPFITLRPGPCTLDEPARNQELRVMPDGQEVLIGPIAGQVETWYANWCEDGMMYVGVDSRDREYVEAAAEGLRIRNVTLAS